MKQYRLINNLMGWCVFAVAAFTYCMTVEPTVSFWDCSEFITAAYKGEVGHPPGAPFFMLTANFFTQFTSDPTKVALCVNVMSALLSAFCILFLFWTITHLTRKLVCDEGLVAFKWQTVLIMGCGLTGAWAYTWSDTFWYSAVEAEVYAYSSMFTALVFWLILKWEEHADEPHSDRWLVLIFYLTGLSIGVHLLNLLCLPALALVFYYKRHPEARAGGTIAAIGVSMLLVAAVLYGVVPGAVKVGGLFELFFINTLGFSFNIGLAFYLFVLLCVISIAIWISCHSSNRIFLAVFYTLAVLLLGIPFMFGSATLALSIGMLLTAALVVLLLLKKGGDYILSRRFLNTSLLCMLVLMVGYSTYAVTLIRSLQNPPMDQNSPEDIFSLGSYMGREQYGDTPLLYGPAFSSKAAYEPVVKNGKETWVYMFEADSTMRRAVKNNADEMDYYEKVQSSIGLTYPGAFKMFFPRMHSSAHADAYNAWMGGVTMRDVTADWTASNGREFKNMPGKLPTQVQNIGFFVSYQMYFMYWRYFLWNFAGRQNDLPGNGQQQYGNWITGFPLIDNALYGDQDALPDDLKNNKGHNVYYCLPLILGFIGLFWQLRRGREGRRQFWVVFFLFVMTGLAIVLYLNQTPQQPRERDYAYAGSFYAFAIWIGLGVAAVAGWIKRMLKGRELFAASLASGLCLLVPIQMVSQTWDDHDRSGRYACHDFGLNYLNTLSEKNMPILFVNGDNETFPLWYAQEVEGQRTDARVCNLSYLGTDWYVDQLRRPVYGSAALPVAWLPEEYACGDGSGFDYYTIDNSLRKELDDVKAKTGVDTYELKYIIDNYIRGNVAKGKPGVMPTDSFVVSVNKEAVLASGMYLPYGKDSIPEKISISQRGALNIHRNRMMIYEMLARNDWQRPLYISYTFGEDNFAGLADYLVLEGLAYRITPFRHERGETVVDTEKMYDNMMRRFSYGNVKELGIYLDETTIYLCRKHRELFSLLIKGLLRAGETDKALEALAKCKEMLPSENIPYEETDLVLAELWLQAGSPSEAARVALRVAERVEQYMRWINVVNPMSESRKMRLVRLCKTQLEALYNISHILDEASPQSAAQMQTRLQLAQQLPFVKDNFEADELQQMRDEQKGSFFQRQQSAESLKTVN